MKTKSSCFFVLWLLCSAVMAQAGAVRNLAGFTTNTYGPNDDGTYPCTGSDSGAPFGCTPSTVPIGFSISFYGDTFTDLYLNNNGNVTFDAPLAEFTPFGLTGTASEIIAPFFADVDTRVGNLVTFGNDTVDGHQAFGVNWIGVGYFDENTDKLNSFQLVLIERSDRNPGDFDIEFNYDQIQWETGDSSGGTDGLGGSSAVAGFSNGTELPGTSFQLRGSQISGEFLDLNPGGLVHGFLNSSVPGRYVIPILNLGDISLNVPRLSQGDSRWAGDAYANSSYTIQQKGCALTCLAMALNYAGVSTDPGALNTLMANDGDFTGTSVNWDAAARDASGGTLEFHGYRTRDTQYLGQSLANGNPVIVGVNLNAAGAPSHFVLVTGVRNGDFLINDPGHANVTTLSAYGNNFETRGYVGDPPGDVSGLDFTVADAADLLVVDPLGRRTGFDPASGMILEEIPGSVHFLDALEDSDLTGAPGTNTSYQVEIYQPIQGLYQVFLVGTNSGAFVAAVRAYAPSGAKQPPLNLVGTKSTTAITPFLVRLGGTGVAAQPFTNAYAWTATPTNGSLPLTVQFTAPNVDTAGNVVTNWNWHFGDGGSSVLQNPTHVYEAGGTYFPGLVATDTTGGTVVGLGPAIVLSTLAFTANPTTGPAPLTVQFAATNVDSAGHAITQWNWAFGDGDTSTLRNPTHTYVSAGSFSPVLLATNSLGWRVGGVGPASITASPVVMSSGLVLNGSFETGDFTDWLLSGADPDDNFVDDGSSSGLVPIFGTYCAALGSAGDLSYLSQTLTTTAGARYALSFWLDVPDDSTPTEFLASWNGNILYDQVNLPPIGWTNVQLLVSATGSSTVLKFGFQNDLSYLGLEGISVTPAQPGISGVSLFGANVMIYGINGLAGATYQALTSTSASLPLSQWTQVATTTLSTGGSFTVTVPNAVSSGVHQRFYVLKLQ